MQAVRCYGCKVDAKEDTMTRLVRLTILQHSGCACVTWIRFIGKRRRVFAHLCIQPVGFRCGRPDQVGICLSPRFGLGGGAGAQNRVRGASGAVVALGNGWGDTGEGVGLKQGLVRDEIVGHVRVAVQRDAGGGELHARVVHLQEVFVRLEGLVLTWF